MHLPANITHILSSMIDIIVYGLELLIQFFKWLEVMFLS